MMVGHASAYQAAPVDWSVHSMDHIIFRRAGQPPCRRERSWASPEK